MFKQFSGGKLIAIQPTTRPGDIFTHYTTLHNTLHTLQVSHYFSLFGQLNLPVNPTLDQQPNKQTNNQIF